MFALAALPSAVCGRGSHSHYGIVVILLLEVSDDVNVPFHYRASTVRLRTSGLCKYKNDHLPLASNRNIFFGTRHKLAF